MRVRFCAFDLKTPAYTEACGVMLGSRNRELVVVKKWVKLKNHHPKPENKYALSMADVEKVKLKYPQFKVIGPWHSHTWTDAWSWPTPEDYEGLPHKTIGAIVHEKFNELTFYSHEARIISVFPLNFVEPETILTGRDSRSRGQRKAPT
jgi:hypothetical protein